MSRLPLPSESKQSVHLIRAAVILWSALFVVLTVKGFMQPMERSVYGSFAHGARDFWANEATYGNGGFYYGPVFALMMTPFALLPNSWGAVLWYWLNTGVFLYALVRFHREIIAVRWPRISLAPFLLLTLVGSARSLYSAQSNALIVGLLMLGAVEVLHRRWWRAAFCFGLPVHLKIWPIAASALLAVQRPRKLILPIALAIVVLAATPLVTHSPDYVVSYYGKWKACLAERQSTAERWVGYRDGWTLWESTVGPVNKHVYTAIQLGAAGLVLAWTLTNHLRGQNECETLVSTLALWAGWQMLLGPGSERLTLSILAPFAAWLLLKSYHSKQGRTLVTIACLLTFVLGIGEIERKVLLISPWANAAFPAGVAVFMLAVVWPHEWVARVFRREATPTSTTQTSAALRTKAA